MNRSTKQTLSWVALLVGLFVIIIALLMAGRSDTDDGAIAVAPEFEEGVDHVQGNADAPILIVEYSDFECPYCAQFAGVTSAQLKQKFGDDIAFVYRHYPLVTIHDSSLLAAYVSEAAAKQGKFWEVHDVLYAQQAQWSRSPQTAETFADLIIAAGVQIDKEALVEAVESDEVQDRVQRDRKAATRLGLTGTPTIFVNGNHIQNPSYGTLENYIQSALTQGQ